MILNLSTIAVSLVIVAEGDVDGRVLILRLFFKYNDCLKLSHFSRAEETIKDNH